MGEGVGGASDRAFPAISDWTDGDRPPDGQCAAASQQREHRDQSPSTWSNGGISDDGLGEDSAAVTTGCPGVWRGALGVRFVAGVFVVI